METEFNWEVVEDVPSAYILMEKSLFPKWGGTLGTCRQGVFVEVEEFDATDAGRALQVSEPVGLTEIEGGSVLVVSSGHSASWIPLESGGGAIVLEVEAVPGGDTVSPEEVLMQVPSDKWILSDVVFEIRHPELIFCSANEGYDQPIAMGYANVRLQPGSYRASSATFFFDDEPCLAFIRLIPVHT